MSRTVEKVRENRLRRMAHRQGLTLCKSRSRDPRAIDYGYYGLAAGHRWVEGDDNGRLFWTLDDVEEYLTTDHG